MHVSICMPPCRLSVHLCYAAEIIFSSQLLRWVMWTSKGVIEKLLVKRQTINMTHKLCHIWWHPSSCRRAIDWAFLSFTQREWETDRHAVSQTDSIDDVFMVPLLNPPLDRSIFTAGTGTVSPLSGPQRTRSPPAALQSKPTVTPPQLSFCLAFVLLPFVSLLPLISRSNLLSVCL